MAKVSGKHVCALLLGLFLQCGVMQAHAATLDLESLLKASEPDMDAWLQEPTQQLKWSDWDYVQLVKRDAKEAGKPNAHPVQINAEQLAEVLLRMTCKTAGETRKLFNEEEVLRLSRAASGALAVASADQDFVFRTAVRHMDFGLLGQKMVNSGRIFVEGGRLNILIGTQLSDALLAVRSGMQPFQPMNPGTRSKVSGRVELTGGVSSKEQLLRPDWLALDLTQLPSPTEKAATKKDTGRTAAQPAAVQPVVAPAAAVAPAAPQAAPATPAVVAPAVPGNAEERLTTLKRLFEKGLISDSEYQQKRAEVLRNL
ncbi:SHOCT domain-containing protein [Uliginosibacterium gangwonense]|uniref:SHOCT domain-containing protein n=1 Tax=Uliginosibacterium gangwonense TaxID=392736 RepID=UPI00035F1C77|nr:SHOCT domain-containing protein [Uliginosibacterium gangwonense]